MTPTTLHRGECFSDSRHQFVSLLATGGSNLEFRYRVFTRADAKVIVLQETPPPELPIVFNNIDQICSELLPLYVSEPGQRDRIAWVIHLPPFTIGSVDAPEVFALVTFECFFPPSDSMARALFTETRKTSYGWLARPFWQRITRDQVQELIGLEFED